jgi:hypothetical protein
LLKAVAYGNRITVYRNGEVLESEDDHTEAITRPIWTKLGFGNLGGGSESFALSGLLQDVTNARKAVRIPGPAATNGLCTPWPVKFKVPKLRRQTFETAIIECYRRRESSVEEALIELYLAVISVRRVEDITEALWGTRVSPSTVSNLNQNYAKIEAWRNGGSRASIRISTSTASS